MRKPGSTLTHLHIGKNGGTSLDSLLKSLKKQKKIKGRFCGGHHFDWSVVEEELPGSDVLLVLRDPGKRTLSHVEFAKTLKWTQGSELRDLSLEELL